MAKAPVVLEMILLFYLAIIHCKYALKFYLHTGSAEDLFLSMLQLAMYTEF